MHQPLQSDVLRNVEIKTSEGNRSTERKPFLAVEPFGAALRTVRCISSLQFCSNFLEYYLVGNSVNHGWTEPARHNLFRSRALDGGLNMNLQ